MNDFQNKPYEELNPSPEEFKAKLAEQEKVLAEQRAAAETQESEKLRQDEEKIKAEDALHEKHSAETSALVKDAQEKAANMDSNTKPEQQQQEFEAQANRLNGAFQRQDGERADLYANNTASTSLGQQLQNDSRETLAEERNAQRVQGTHDVCQAFAEKQFEIANQPAVDQYANLLAERGDSAAAVNEAVDKYSAKLGEQQKPEADRLADIVHEQSFDAVRQGKTPGEPAGAPAEEPDYPVMTKSLEALSEASEPDAKSGEEDIWENKDNPLYGQRGSEKAYALDKLEESQHDLQDQWHEKHDNPEPGENPSPQHVQPQDMPLHSPDLPPGVDPANSQGDACQTTTTVGVPEPVPHHSDGPDNITDPITPLVISGLATYVILKDRFQNKEVPGGDTRPPDPPEAKAQAEAPKPAEPQPGYVVSQTYATDPAEFQRAFETALQPPSAGSGGNQPNATTVEVPNVPPPTFGKTAALGDVDADLVKMYAERQKDLGKADQGVQEFASQLKTMETQAAAPAPAAPAPEVQTAAPAPAAPAPAAPAPAAPAPSISPSL